MRCGYQNRKERQKKQKADHIIKMRSANHTEYPVRRLTLRPSLSAGLPLIFYYYTLSVPICQVIFEKTIVRKVKLIKNLIGGHRKGKPRFKR